MLADDNPGPLPTQNLARKTKQELVELATRLGIDSSGKRDDIKARLKTHYDAAPPPAGAAPGSSSRQRPGVPRPPDSLPRPPPRSRARPDERGGARREARAVREGGEESEDPESAESGPEAPRDVVDDDDDDDDDGGGDDDSEAGGGCPPPGEDFARTESQGSAPKAGAVRAGRRCEAPRCALGYDSHAGVLRPGFLPIFASLYRIQKQISTVRHVIYMMLFFEFLQLCRLAFPFNNVTVGPVYFLTTGRSHVFEFPVPDFDAVCSAEVFWTPLAVWLGEFLILPALAGTLVNFDRGRQRAASELSFCVSRLLLVAWNVRGFAAASTCPAETAPADGAAPRTALPFDGFDPRLPVDIMVATGVVGILFSFYDGMMTRR